MTRPVTVPEQISAAQLAERGLLLINARAYDEGIDVYRRSLELNPVQPAVWNNLGLALTSRRQLHAAIECVRNCIELTHSFPAAHSNLLSLLNYSPDIPPEQVFEEHRKFAAIYSSTQSTRIPRQTSQSLCSPPAGVAPIRIGYVSGSFCQHSNFYTIEPVLRSHSRPEFHLTCYSNSPREDWATAQLREAADSWRLIHNLSDDAAAMLIQGDGIDVLVDLSGHTEGNRLTLFERRVAPVQVTWLGYPNTTGLPSIDYRLTCGRSDPPGLTEHLHSERIVRLPQFFCYRPPADAEDVGPLPALATGSITFGCFNNIIKITDAAIAAWAQILVAVPGSRLVLKSRGFGSSWVRSHTYKRFERLAVDPERVEMIEFVAAPRNHFELYNRIDIALDTWPYNGTVTTCEALWMGTPVVSLVGKVHAARVGLSLLSAAGLQWLAAPTVSQYIATATALAADLHSLRAIREGLRGRLVASPLFDYTGFTRNMESAYRTMLGRAGGKQNSYA